MSERWIFGSLAALLAVLWLATLAGRPLFNPDEGRYAEIPREMLAGGDWVIPHLNGLDYIEKPPLQFWATALSYRLLGVSEFAARLYCALTALGTLFLTWFTARRLFNEAAGWRAVAVLSGMSIFVVLGQLLTLDMSLTFYMTMSLTAFLLAQQPGAARGWMLLAWAGAALGVLTKGLVAAALPTAVLMLYSAYRRDFAPWRRLNLAWGLPLFLLITVPWHWLAARRLDDFLEFFFVHEHLARYLTPIADREEAWWFFGWVLAAGTVPWSLPVIRALAGGWRRRAGTTAFDARAFLWIWVLFICIFFSLSDSKLMPYILPVMPALALLIGSQPDETSQRDFSFTAIATVIAGVALGLVSLNWARVIASSDRSAYFLPLAGSIGRIALLLMATGGYVLAQRARGATRCAVFLGVGWCLTWLLFVRAAALLAPIYSGIDLAAALPAADRTAPLYCVGTYDQTLPFYLRRSVTLVRYRGELDYGLGKMPDAEIADLAEFQRRWSAQERAFAVMRKNMFKSLESQGVPMRLVTRTAEYVLVARQ